MLTSYADTATSSEIDLFLVFTTLHNSLDFEVFIWQNKNARILCKFWMRP